MRQITADEIKMVQSWFSGKDFRTRATGIRVFQQIKTDCPDLSEDELKAEVKKLVTGE